MSRIFAVWIATLLASCGGGSSEAPDPPPLRPLPQVNAVPSYGTVGSGPHVVVLSEDEQNTLYNAALTGGIVPDLISAGFTVVSLDLPCHGADADPGVAPLYCWARRIAAGDLDIFTRFCAGLSLVLDQLGAPSVGILGISRGGYVATTCTAYDQRFVDIVLENPVTNLNYLSEFQGLQIDYERFTPYQYIAALVDRRKMLSIDRVDTRVGASLAIDFAHSLGAELVVTDAPNHEIDPATAMAAAAWFQAQGLR